MGWELGPSQELEPSKDSALAMAWGPSQALEPEEDSRRQGSGPRTEPSQALEDPKLGSQVLQLKMATDQTLEQT